MADDWLGEQTKRSQAFLDGLDDLMGKHKGKQKVEILNIVEVPDADDMDDDIFIKHLEARHASECKIETTIKIRKGAWVSTYRAFHDRLHRLAVFGQYDHEHEE